MLIERKGKIYLTRRSLLRMGAAATALGFVPKPIWAAPPHGAATQTSGLDNMTLLLQAMAPNSWANIVTQGGQPSSDYEQVCFYNGPHDPNYVSGAPDYNATVAADLQPSCFDNTGQFESVAYDPHANRYLIGGGGGHSTGYENSIMQFDFSSLRWRRLTTPDDSVQTFNGTGSIDLSHNSDTGPNTMTITAISAGFVLPNQNVVWPSFTNSPVFIIAQLTSTEAGNAPGGTGTYSVTWNPALYSEIQANPPTSGTNLQGAPSANQTQAGQTAYGTNFNYSCPNNRTGTVGVHTYSNMTFLPNWPTAQGSIWWGGLRAPWMWWDCSSVTNINNPLPSQGTNWTPPSRPTDSTGLPTVANCTPQSAWHLSAGPWPSSSNQWNWPNVTNCVAFCGQQSYLFAVPGQTKLFQQSGVSENSNVVQILYDPTQDTSGLGSEFLQNIYPNPPGPTPSPNPFTVINGTGSNFMYDGFAGSTIRGNSAWTVGRLGAVPADHAYTGIRSWALPSGNGTDFVATGTDTWILTSSTPFMAYHPPSDSFICIGTDNYQATQRNTSAYASQNPISPGTPPNGGNVFDVINATTGVITQLVTGGHLMPNDMTISGHSNGFQSRMVYDSIHNCFVLLTCPPFDPNPVYVYKPDLNFPVS